MLRKNTWYEFHSNYLKETTRRALWYDECVYTYMHVWMLLMLFLALNCSYPHHVMFKTCILKKVEVTVTSFIVEIKNYRRLSEWEDTKQSIINFWLNHRMMANIIFLFTGVAKILDKSIQYRHSFSSFHSLTFQ